jgi:hypothetical protein
MTLPGINLLNEIIGETVSIYPSKILNELDRKLVEILPNGGKNTIRNLMELTILVFSKNSKELQYATGVENLITNLKKK